MIPLATTTVTVHRQDPEEIHGEPTFSGDSPPDMQVVASGVRANIGLPTGVGNRGGTERSNVNYVVQLDLFDGELTRLDEIEDERTGIRYEVQWAMKRTGLGMDHWSAELLRTEGLV